MMPPILRVLHVGVVKEYTLEIQLSNGKVGDFNMLPYMKSEFFSELKDKEYFSKVTMVNGGGGIAWPNEQDLSADTLNQGLFDVRVKSVQEMLKEACIHYRMKEDDMYWGKAFDYVIKQYSVFFADKYGCKCNLDKPQ